ncbi:MAG: phytoene/squalene synthase family protein [Steroidobacteraceae bacterium]|jgi:phytoene synthase
MPHRSNVSSHASVADVAACRASLRGGSKTFFAASLALPHTVRRPATALYAFCRMADDAIDHGTNHEATLRELHRRLELIYLGVPRSIAADRAFADCARHFAIPKQYPLALLEGFGWDAIGRRYEDLSALRSYGVRVAGTVGAMMAMVMNVRERSLVARACDLGVAMQLTNIARDVGEDARNGRLYLPLRWMREAGLDPDAWLARPVFSRPLGRVIERLLAEAQALYERSDSGLAQLPQACRPGMHAARLLYAEIGHEVARRGFDSVSQRAVVPWRRKARILADACSAAKRQSAAASIADLVEGEFLLDAFAPDPLTAALPEDTARERALWPRVEDRVVWLVDLFERLERRDRAAGQAANLS